MIFENNDFGIGGNVNFFTEAKFYTHECKNHHSEPENNLLNICIQVKWTYETLLRLKQIYDKKLPFMKIQKTSPLPPPPPPPPKKKNKKNEIFLTQLLIIRDIQNLTLYICFWGWQKEWNILKKITYHQSCQNPRWQPIMVKELFLV